MKRYIDYEIYGNRVLFTYADGSAKTAWIESGPGTRIYLTSDDSPYTTFLPNERVLRKKLVRTIVGYEVEGIFPEIEIDDLPLLLDSLIVGDNFGVSDIIDCRHVRNLQGVIIPKEKIITSLPGICSCVDAPPELKYDASSIMYYEGCYTKQTIQRYLKLP